MSKRKPTMADLAHELGVSTATVSRALKDYPDISPETKERVLELAKAWNYRPNALAASLRKQESRTLGVLVPQIVNHFFSSVIKGIVDEAYESGYRVILCQSDESDIKEAANADALLDSQVDGVLASVAHGTVSFEHFQMFVDEDVPVVFFDKIPQGFNSCSKVIVDDRQGACGAVEHLIAQGCKRIAHIGGPFQAYTAIQRLAGYRDALLKAGIEPDDAYIRECTDVTIDEGRAFARELLALPEPPDGLFCVTDSAALGAMRTFREAGWRVPEDIAIVGFSDWEMNTLVEPQLSSVAQPGYEMGKTAVKLLLEEIRALKEEITIEHEVRQLPTSLKIRASSQRIV
ncbi:MAG: LacI family DNA-binding transcriptional regulator [Bacteroidia bacterium]